MEYLANIKLGKYSYYYKDEELLFTFKINLKFYVFVIDCSVYDKDNYEVLSFRENNFLIGTKLRILEQSLPQSIEIRRKNIDSYSMKVMGKEIYLKITYVSFLMKNFGEFFIGNKSYGTVIKKTKMTETDFIFDFKEENDINYYCMLLFAMHTVGYGNIR